VSGLDSIKESTMLLIEVTYLMTLHIHAELIYKKVHTVQALRKIFKLSLKEAKTIVDGWDNEDPFYTKREFKVNAYQFSHAYCVLHNNFPVFTDSENVTAPSFSFWSVDPLPPTEYDDISLIPIVGIAV
jgi:hypothetical protein